MMFAIKLPVFIAAALTGLSLTAPTQAQQATMSFFVTSVGKGDGADLGALAGADATLPGSSPKPRARPKLTGMPT